MSESITNAKSHLRIGLLVNDEQVPAWAYRMIERLQEGQYAEIVALVVRENASATRSASDVCASKYSSRIAETWRKFYRHQDQSNRRNPSPVAKVPLADLLGDIPKLRARVTTTRWSDRVIEEDLAIIREANLDVLIRLGFRILRGGILSAARYGVWSFHHGDNRVNRGGPAGYWEVMERERGTGATLQLLTESLDNGIVLARTKSGTHPFSVVLSRQALYWQAMSLIPRELEKLYRCGGGRIDTLIRDQEQALEFYDRPLYSTHTMSAAQALQHLRRWLWRWLRAKVHYKLYREHWELRYSLDANVGSSFFRFKHLRPPPDRYWADPCVIADDGKYYVFVEDFDSKSKLGHVSVLTVGADGKLEGYDKALERPYHLSYPFVFAYQDNYYMIPETGANRSVEIYRSQKFPFDWQLVRTLFSNVYAVDATLHKDQDDRWWLFTNMVENAGASSSSELFLFYNEGDPVHGEWKPHAGNPIVSDVTKARPAGPLFEHGGRLFRPAQDCSGRYGRGLAMNEVVELSPDRYSERVHARIYANWDPLLRGTHTFCRAGDLTIIDVVRYAPRWAPLRHLPDWLHNHLSLPY